MRAHPFIDSDDEKAQVPRPSHVKIASTPSRKRALSPQLYSRSKRKPSAPKLNPKSRILRTATPRTATPRTATPSTATSRAPVRRPAAVPQAPIRRSSLQIPVRRRRAISLLTPSPPASPPGRKHQSTRPAESEDSDDASSLSDYFPSIGQSITAAKQHEEEEESDYFPSIGRSIAAAKQHEEEEASDYFPSIGRSITADKKREEEEAEASFQKAIKEAAAVIAREAKLADQQRKKEAAEARLENQRKKAAAAAAREAKLADKRREKEEAKARLEDQRKKAAAAREAKLAEKRAREEAEEAERDAAVDYFTSDIHNPHSSSPSTQVATQVDQVNSGATRDNEVLSSIDAAAGGEVDVDSGATRDGEVPSSIGTAAVGEVDVISGATVNDEVLPGIDAAADGEVDVSTQAETILPSDSISQQIPQTSFSSLDNSAVSLDLEDRRKDRSNEPKGLARRRPKSTSTTSHDIPATPRPRTGSNTRHYISSTPLRRVHQQEQTDVAGPSNPRPSGTPKTTQVSSPKVIAQAPSSDDAIRSTPTVDSSSDGEFYLHNSGSGSTAEDAPSKCRRNGDKRRRKRFTQHDSLGRVAYRPMTHVERQAFNDPKEIGLEERYIATYHHKNGTDPSKEFNDDLQKGLIKRWKVRWAVIRQKEPWLGPWSQTDEGKLWLTKKSSRSSVAQKRAVGALRGEESGDEADNEGEGGQELEVDLGLDDDSDTPISPRSLRKARFKARKEQEDHEREIRLRQPTSPRSRARDRELALELDTDIDLTPTEDDEPTTEEERGNVTEDEEVLSEPRSVHADSGDEIEFLMLDELNNPEDNPVVPDGCTRIYTVWQDPDVDGSKGNTIGRYETLAYANRKAEHYLKHVPGGTNLSINFGKSIFGQVTKPDGTEIYVSIKIGHWRTDQLEFPPPVEKAQDPAQSDSFDVEIPPMYYVVKTCEIWKDEEGNGDPELKGIPDRTHRVILHTYDRLLANKKCHNTFLSMTRPNSSIEGALDLWSGMLKITIDDLLEESLGYDEDGRGCLLVLDDDDNDGQLCCTNWIHNRVQVFKAKVEGDENWLVG